MIQVYSMEDFMDVYWTSQDILQGERVDRGPSWENICIGLFHVSGHLDHFGRYLFVSQN